MFTKNPSPHHSYSHIPFTAKEDKCGIIIDVNNPPLILIIDDDPNFREIFSAMLKIHGFNPETAEDAILGIEKIKQTKPDLVLMDVIMPKMNGIEAFIKIKEDPTIKETPVLFMTNLGDFNIEAKLVDEKFSQEVGATGYLRKTDDHEVLAKKIEEMFKKN
jgi:CheY-like chemotaxis protein